MPNSFLKKAENSAGCKQYVFDITKYANLVLRKLLKQIRSLGILKKLVLNQVLGADYKSKTRKTKRIIKTENFQK